MSENQRIINVSIEDEMKTAYIDYSMSVIVSRALPDVRDGLKPVHRRVLYGMQDLGVTYNKSHKKSARIVGEVLGKYHPHGDSSVYDTMVRMAQSWSLRYPLVDGQGNFGSMDGDSPAAMRYTEARLSRISDEMLADINKETVDFALNFDDTLEEPKVLPAKFPNLLVNGASGIAVGMATNMLPHNLVEVCDAVIATIDEPDISLDDLLKYIKGPDFPTGGIIYGISEVRDSYETGRGRVVIRGKAEIVTSDSGKETIIITEIPYQVNKSILVMKIAELMHEKKIIGISDIRDESDRTGVRVVVEVKRDAIASVILSQLYKFSPLQTSYGINNIALVNGRPRVLSLKDLIREFIKFRIEVIVRRTKYDLRKAEERAHILEGLLIALDNLDEVISIIRHSKTVDEAHRNLVERFNLSDIQSKAILEMRLQRLTGLERDKVKNEYEEIIRFITDLRDILTSESRQREIVKDELREIIAKYGDKRRTLIEFAEAEINIEDLIADEEMIVTISHLGYIKRTKSSEYRTQSRGGRGAMGAKTRNEDFVEQMFVASSHNYLLLFTKFGKCHWLRVYEIPEANKTSSGRAIQNLIQLAPDDKVKAFIIIKNLNDVDFVNNNFVVFCTKNGTIKKTSVEQYSRPRSGGITALGINENDELLEAKLTNGNCEILLANKGGRANRFPESAVRPMGRTATGVRGITLDENKDDAVVGMVCIDKEDKSTTVLVVSEKGTGKRTELDEYRITNRGGKGVKTINITEKTGQLVAIKSVKEDEDLMITNRSGIMIRMNVSQLPLLGRATQGVRVIKLQEHDSISDITIVPHSAEEDEVGEVEGDSISE
ncbi:MAG: DNA gyrase subunit A [Saprospiraceae bacterium]|nr:DNA gyrase subunit A [Saprospiraceae bacterium]